MVDLDPDPHWPKMLDPYPYWNQYGFIYLLLFHDPALLVGAVQVQDGVGSGGGGRGVVNVIFLSNGETGQETCTCNYGRNRGKLWVNSVPFCLLPGVVTVPVPYSHFLSFCYPMDMDYCTEPKICWKRTSGNNFILILHVPNLDTLKKNYYNFNFFEKYVFDVKWQVADSNRFDGMLWL